LENTNATVATATVSLALSKTDSPPPLTGMFYVDIAFEDPNESWYATWVAEPGAGSDYAVTATGGTTTVRMGANSVSLAPVPLAPCETRKAAASVRLTNVFPSPNYDATLDMSGSLAVDGSVFATPGSTCNNPPPQ
jgi:hypothetical protein